MNGPPWYVRPVFFCADVDRAVAHYVEVLGFAEDWRHPDDGARVVAQVARDDFEVILCRDARRAGSGRVFLSLAPGQATAFAAQVRERGGTVTPDHWGMPVLTLRDADGNEVLCTDDTLQQETSE